MRLFIKSNFLLMLLILTSTQTFSYITTAELYFECSGNQNYTFYLDVYIECGGANDLSQIPSQTVQLNSSNQKISDYQITLSRTGVEDVDLFCGALTSRCDGGTNRGLKKVSYRGKYNMGALGSASDWVISWMKNYRSLALNTIDDSRVYPYYVAVTFDNTMGCNNSVRVLNTPVITACVNESNSYDLQLVDSDGDDLSTSFELPRMSALSDIPLENGYSDAFPITTDTFQLNDGVLSYYPTSPGENGMIDLVVAEERLGKVISTSRIGLQISTFNCSSNVPSLTGLHGAVFLDTSVCANTTLDESFVSLWAFDDQTSAANLEVEIIGQANVLKHKLVGDSLLIYADWTPTGNDVGMKCFYIKVTDDACPLNREIVRELRIEVLPSPVFTLGEDFVFPCDEPVVLSPSSTIEGTNYMWLEWEVVEDSSFISDTLSNTTPSHLLMAPQYIALVAQNKEGCSAIDSVKIEPSIEAEVALQNWCYGDSTAFMVDAVTKFDEIVAYHWSYGNGEFAVAHSPLHRKLYDQKSLYDVKVVLVDNRMCKDTLSLEVDLCEAPRFNFSIADSCNNSTTLIDLTDYSGSCGLAKMNLSNGRYEVQAKDQHCIVFNAKPHVGSYDFRALATLQSGCEIDSTFAVNLITSPTIAFEQGGLNLEDFAYRCNGPDTTIRAVVKDTGHGGLNRWSWGGSQAIFSQLNDSTVYTEEPGYFEAIYYDEMGCYHVADLIISDMTTARFQYEKACVVTDTISFLNQSIGGLARLDSIRWDFGDGLLSSAFRPSHHYPVSGDYKVKLEVVDEFECHASTIHTVFIDYPLTDTINVTPDLFSTIVCAQNDTVTAFLQEFVHADTISWWIEGKPQYYFKTVSGDQHVSNGVEQTIVFDQPGNYSLSASISYNDQFPISTGAPCTHELVSKPLSIKPELAASVEVGRMCVGDSAQFEVDLKASGGVLTEVNWVIYKRSDSTVRAQFEGEKGTLVFDELEKYFYTVSIQDSEGCEISKSSFTDRQFIEVEQIPKAYVEIGDKACANQLSQFQVKVADVGTIERWYVYDYTNESFVSSTTDPTKSDFRYVPGEAGEHSVQEGSFSYAFGQPGKHPIAVYMVGAVGAVSECRSRLDTFITVDTLPKIDFNVTNVCAVDEATTLVSTATARGGDAISAYAWFGDDGLNGSDSSLYHVYREGGFHEVSLVVEAEKCTDTLTKTDVYVKHKPSAAYSIDEQSIEAHTPILFTDESISSSELDSSYYVFGDGNSADVFDPTHIYGEVKVFNVKHVVLTDEGCRDTVVERTDLNTYLDLPTAFTPNSDGKNDELALIYKSIKKLDEFKVFNRWGQLVFDAEGDPSATWDGTIEGQPQEKGIYTIMVKGLGAYNTYFEFQRNVTLIR